MGSHATILLGAASLDIYKDSGLVLPGGGCLNMAYHWRQLHFPHLYLTRIGPDGESVFLDFFRRHQIDYLPDCVVGAGRSPAVDVTILLDGQPFMDNFVEGVLADFQLTPAEEQLMAEAEQVHTVLVNSLVQELGRLNRIGRLERPFISADFLDFRHYTVERLAETLAIVDLGFVGWPNEADDPMLHDMRQVVFDLGKLLVVTLGSRGVLVWDGRSIPRELFFAVEPVPVQGTTIGCGDAFIAYFLAEFWRTGNLPAAVVQGKLGGALATKWQRPLPEKAYTNQ